MIVTGILLAFGIDAAWESRQEDHQEAEYIAALKGELEGALSLLPESESIDREMQHAHEALIAQFGEGSLAPPDSLMLWLSQLSRPMISNSVSSASMRRRESSTSAGTACWLIATRAQAVSSRLTDLSGSCRAGI